MTWAGRSVGNYNARGWPEVADGVQLWQAIRFTRNGFAVRGNGKLSVAKVGQLKVAWSRLLPSIPSSVTVVKDAAGRYFASFVVDADDQPLHSPWGE